MGKQKPVALYNFAILAIILGSLYLYTRPGTLDTLHDFINFEEVEMAGGSVHLYNGEDTIHYTTQWFLPGEPEYDRLLALVKDTEFNRSIKTLTPLPEVRRSPRLEEGMYCMEVMFSHEDGGFILRDYYGELTIQFMDKGMSEEYIYVDDLSAWSTACRDLILEIGHEQESIVVDTAA